ncbi:multiprotein-bridging factor 1 family protein [Jejudonia soesokkakensis]|uniref:Multiprotein-bridging factor 1 family protein n=1 Tax=Jejudonia soesokkakensis TaxID=1323432 RepID=A0ABW2MS80_9FLAO
MNRSIASSKQNIITMKQPELGQQILKLRKQKGLTQEELVEQCNINVRTIQRIEAGEVTPRSYTIKTIMDVLGFDLEKINEQKEILDTSNAVSHSLHLKIAWICGIIYFLLGFLEFAADTSRYIDEDKLLSDIPYSILKVAVLATYIYFMWGFVITGKIFKQYLLKIASFVLIGIHILFYGYDIISLFTQEVQIEYVITTYSIFFGISTFLLGYAVLKLTKPIGTLATITGGLLIGSAVMFILVFMSWLGYIFLIPATLLQIILLFKVAELLQEKTNTY